jgi:hypothetical protein
MCSGDHVRRGSESEGLGSALDAGLSRLAVVHLTAGKYSTALLAVQSRIAALAIPEMLNVGRKRRRDFVRVPQAVHGCETRSRAVERGYGTGKGRIGR